MSINIAVIYDSEVEAVAGVFGEAAAHLAAQVCLLPPPITKRTPRRLTRSSNLGENVEAA